MIGRTFRLHLDSHVSAQTVAQQHIDTVPSYHERVLHPDEPQAILAKDAGWILCNGQLQRLMNSPFASRSSSWRGSVLPKERFVRCFMRGQESTSNLKVNGGQNLHQARVSSTKAP